MSHGDYLRPQGLWPAGTVPTSSDLKKLDIVQARLINGDAGGDWAPDSPLVFGGAGGALQSAGSLISGGVTTYRGGRLVLGANDYVGLSPGRSRTIVFSLARAQMRSSFNRRAHALGPKLIVPPGRPGLQTFTRINQFSIPGRFIHGTGNLASVTLTFTQPTYPAVANGIGFVFGGSLPDESGGFVGIPALVTTPAWVASTSHAVGDYMLPVLTNGNGFYYKCSAISGSHLTGTTEPAWPTVIGATIVDAGVTWKCTGTSGQVSKAKVANPTAYVNGGNPQSVTFTTDPVNTNNFLDPKLYEFTATILADYGTILHSLAIGFNAITSNAFE